MTFRSLALVLALASSGLSHAATPDYQPLPGANFSGTVAAESGPFTGAENWAFYTFNAAFGDTVTLNVAPTSPDFDVFIAVWYGLESDTANYFDMTSGGVNSVFVASADGLDAFNTGVGVPAQISFTNIYGAEPFVLAIADYTDGLGSGPLAFSVTAAVPEAETWGLMLAGLGLVGYAVRRRRV